MCHINQRLDLTEAPNLVPRVVCLVEMVDSDGCALLHFPEPSRLAVDRREILRRGGMILSIREVFHFGHLHTHVFTGQSLLESDYELYRGGGKFLSVESTEAFGCGCIDSDADLKALMARLNKGNCFSIFESMQ